MRRPLTLLLILTLLALAACTGKPTEDKTPAPVDDELFILHEAGALREPLDQVIREFESKYPHIKVNVHELQTSEITRRAEDPTLYDGFDLVIGQGWIPHRLTPLGLAQDMGALELPPLDPTTVEMATYFGEMPWIPIELRTWMFMLHQETFDRLGIEMPGVNWTYTEFDAVMRKLQAAEVHKPLNFRFLYSSVVLAFGGGFYDPQAEKWTFDTPENREALSFLRRLTADGLWTTSLDMSVELDGENPTPLWLGESRELPLAGWVGLPFPVGPAGRVATSRLPRGVAILNTTVRPEVAAMFVREMLGSTAYAEAGVRPTVDNPAALKVWEERVGSETALAIHESWNSLRSSPSGAEPVNLMEPLERYLDGEITLDELLDDLYAQVNQAR